MFDCSCYNHDISLFKNEKQSNQLWNAYHKALQSGDKDAAIKTGKDYCAFITEGKLTDIDEQFKKGFSSNGIKGKPCTSRQKS
jgi:hypothetical protein